MNRNPGQIISDSLPESRLESACEDILRAFKNGENTVPHLSALHRELKIQRASRIFLNTGGFANPYHKQLGEYTPVTISRALSKICRFGGHTRYFYSVADHCCEVAERCSMKNRLWALLHDAAECWIGDIVQPLKFDLRIRVNGDKSISFESLEYLLLEQISQRFGLSMPIPLEVIEVDRKLCKTEIAQLVEGGEEYVAGEELFTDTVTANPPEVAEFRWRSMFNACVGVVG